MKLKILAIVALAVVGVGAAFVALGGLPLKRGRNHPVPDRRGHHRRRHRRRRRDRAVAASRRTASRSVRRPTSRARRGERRAASTTWTATSVKVKVGDTVKKGEVLATADTTDLKRPARRREHGPDDGQDPAGDRQDEPRRDRDDDRRRSARRRSASTTPRRRSRARTKTRDDLQTQIKLATLTAPIDGIVTTVNIVTGLDAPSGDAIVIDATTFQVTTDVVESDLASMAVGQTATVLDRGRWTRRRPARSRRSPRPPSGSTTGGVVSYAVTVSLSDAPAAVRAGMTADVTITIDSATNVLTVPAAALRGTTGDYTRPQVSARTARRSPSPSRSGS